MAPTFARPQPDERFFQAAQSEESDLRRRYLAIDSSGPPDALDHQDQQLVERSAAYLEIVVSSACLIEASREPAAPPIDGSDLSRSHYRARVKQLCGLDPEEAVPRAVAVLELQIPSGQPAPLPSADAMLRAIRSMLEAFPIERLEAVSKELGLEGVGHRCRVAYDALRAYVVRNDQTTKAKIGLVGRAYSQGSMTVTDAATLLDLSVPDTVALLESQGHQRPIDVLSLAPDERTARLDMIRRDRLARAGQVAFSTELLGRDVIASERIEGVDARAWIANELM